MRREVPGDIFGALVWETEMHRVRNPTSEDWGPPDWHLYDPSDRDGYDGLVSLTESLKKGLKRLPPTVPRFAVLDPTAYFVALATAVREEGQSDWWSLKGTSDSAATREALKATREEVERYLREGAFSPGVESYPPEWVRCLDRLPERWRAFRTT